MQGSGYQTVIYIKQTNKQTNSVALVRERTIPTERPPPAGEDSAKFADRVTNSRCCIGTAFSPDDGHIVARNM